MKLAALPFFDRLADSRNVLLAGAGGGFDVFAGLPLYFALRDRGTTVHLANLSFSYLGDAKGRRLTPAVLEVTPDAGGSRQYFPEKHLAAWLAENGEAGRVFTFEKTGVAPLRAAYEAVVRELGVDTVLLVDGGTNSLLRGDEAGLGTPTEDMASIAAVDDLDVPTKLLASVGFGVDTFHGVCHAHVLESIAALAESGGYLGAFSLLPQMTEVARYRSAVEAAHERMPEQPSIVNASILSATDGDYGDVHRTERTRGSKLWINPLMAMYFTFDLAAVARRILYLTMIKNTQTMFEISAVVEAYQRGCERLRAWEPIPV